MKLRTHRISPSHDKDALCVIEMGYHNSNQHHGLCRCESVQASQEESANSGLPLQVCLPVQLLSV